MATRGRRTRDDLVTDVVEVCRAFAPHGVELFRDEVTRDMAEAMFRAHDGKTLRTPMPDGT